MATARKIKIDFDELTEAELAKICSFDDVLLDKLITIRDKKTIEFLRSRLEMSEAERIYMMSVSRAFTDFVDTIRQIRDKKMIIPSQQTTKYKNYGKSSI